MPNCEIHGYYTAPIAGKCPSCVRDYIADKSDRASGKKPIGYCQMHGNYYAKYRGIYEGCPVCAKAKYG